MSPYETVYLYCIAAAVLFALGAAARVRRPVHDQGECVKLYAVSYCWAHEWAPLVFALIFIVIADLTVYFGVQPLRSSNREVAIVSVVPLAAWAFRRRNSVVPRLAYLAAVSLWMVAVFNHAILLGFISRTRP